MTGGRLAGNMTRGRLEAKGGAVNTDAEESGVHSPGKSLEQECAAGQEEQAEPCSYICPLI